ncbi:tetratricopeptide repeat protein [Legionella sp. CNM-4043-24]|uniref:tetratricopeptide repeat protein n=1 Tax=Legionella sp. CNM-4043-24 TaxID=3421646 RepID=UPI00403AFDEF
MMQTLSVKNYFSTLLALLISIPAVADDNLDSCKPNKALALLNQSKPPLEQIKKMLVLCDQRTPQDTQVLLLHGLLARKEGMATKNFQPAINWLQLAQAQAANGNFIPALELALTYEWSGRTDDAQRIYDQVLASNPDSQAGLLGRARIALFHHDYQKATLIYQQLLQKDPRDLEALNGMGRTLMAKGKFTEARGYFEQALQQAQNNPDAQLGLAQSNKALQQTSVLQSNIPSFPLAPFISAMVLKAQSNPSQHISVCESSKGLILLNSKPLQLDEIKKILLSCDKVQAQDTQVLLMHGLLARSQANYPLAIQWLTRARNSAPFGNPVPAQELALTYEWAHQTDKALAVYQELLSSYPELRAALLGKARIAMARDRVKEAQIIYEHFLKKNQQDIDALNGIARVYMARQNTDLANTYLQRVLAIQPANESARIALQQIRMAEQSHQSPKSSPVTARASRCDTMRALSLVNSPRFSVSDVQQILAHCASEHRSDSQVLLARGLLARAQKDYPIAIQWLEQARALAPADDPVPAQELALTYEWAGQSRKAIQIYNEILAKNPNSRMALLGLGRATMSLYQIKKANLIFTRLLQQNPEDVEALNSMGLLTLTNKQFKQSRAYFNESLAIQPGNTGALAGVDLLSDATRYMLSFSEGQYLIDSEHSNSTTLYGYVDLNATDRFIAILTHNTKELQLDIPINPTILPKNSYFVDFQRQIPDRYGWGINYDYRERNDLPLENRIGGNANVYLLPRLQLLGGFWVGTPSPWKNQLYYSSLTLYTDLPFNLTTTGYWTNQEIGGKVETYAFDLSREYSNKGFYDIGTAYIPTQRSWQGHGNFILPVTKNHALEGRYEYYQFNGATIFALGWRVYWA